MGLPDPALAFLVIGPQGGHAQDWVTIYLFISVATIHVCSCAPVYTCNPLSIIFLCEAWSPVYGFWGAPSASHLTFMHD